MSQEGRNPNIVYILADDMGYGDLSCLNPDSRIRTGNLDRIAAEGMRFTDAHASSAVCTPSRYSILTGRYNWRSALKQGVLYGYESPLIEAGRMTVASLLRQQGYATACIGKWHLGLGWARTGETDDDVDFRRPLSDSPCDHGFDYFFGISASLDMPPYVYIENDRVTAHPEERIAENDRLEERQEGRIASRVGKAFWREGVISPDFRHEDVLPELTRRAEEYIRDRAAGDKPFFLYLPLPAPHTPILPAPEFRGRSGTNAYGDFCLMVDWTVGRVMQALHESGQDEDTILIFASDNGCSPMADFSELEASGHHPSYHFRGHKADIYEGGHRIPLLLRWPGRVASGHASDETVCLADLMATCAELVGFKLPDDAGEDSVSNLPLWLGRLGARGRETVVHHSIDGSFSIRRGRWKLELCPGSGGWSHPRPGEDAGLPPLQLYDLKADIGERRNVQAEHPELVAELTKLLAGQVLTGRSTPGAAQPNTGLDFWPQLSWMDAGRPEGWSRS